MPDANDSPQPVNFTAASRVDGRGRHYVGHLEPSWDGPLTTHGGLLQAIALRAIDAEINREGRFQARSVTCHYLRPPQHGEIDIFVDPLRRGRRFASTRATITQQGKPCVAVLATHSLRGLEEVASWALSAPDVPGPPTRQSPRLTTDAIVDAGPDNWLQMPEGAPRFFNQLMLAPRFGSGPFVGPPVDAAVGTSNGGWILTPEPQPIDTAWLTLLVDALWPSVLEPLRVPAMAPTLDLTTHIRADIPEAGLPDQPLLVHNVTRAAKNGLSESDSMIFSEAGVLLAQGRQLQLLQPLEL